MFLYGAVLTVTIGSSLYNQSYNLNESRAINIKQTYKFKNALWQNAEMLGLLLEIFIINLKFLNI